LKQKTTNRNKTRSVKRERYWLKFYEIKIKSNYVPRTLTEYKKNIYETHENCIKDTNKEDGKNV
jgi:hypothetical protein